MEGWTRWPVGGALMSHTECITDCFEHSPSAWSHYWNINPNWNWSHLMGSRNSQIWLLLPLRGSNPKMHQVLPDLAAIMHSHDAFKLHGAPPKPWIHQSMKYSKQGCSCQHHAFIDSKMYTAWHMTKKSSGFCHLSCVPTMDVIAEFTKIARFCDFPQGHMGKSQLFCKPQLMVRIN